MVKLQEITRVDGSSAFHLTIPLGVVEEAQLRKGDDFAVVCMGVGVLHVVRRGAG